MGGEIPIIPMEALESDPLLPEPDWRNVDVTDCLDAPKKEALSDPERKKLEVLEEMTKRIMYQMQEKIPALLSVWQKLTERDVNRITETLRKSETDKPKISVRFGQGALDLATEVGVDNIVDSEQIIKEGLVVMQLPKPLAKYWYRTDGGAKKVNWGRIYGQLYDEFWQGVKYAKEQGLYLKRVNKVGVHDPKKYYYVFVPSFEGPPVEIESMENELEQEAI